MVYVRLLQSCDKLGEFTLHNKTRIVLGFVISFDQHGHLPALRR